MSVTDLHAHVTPQRFRDAIRDGRRGMGSTSLVGELDVPGFRKPIDVRLRDMDEMGVDVQAVSPNAGFYQYDNDPAVAAEIARECNDEIAEMCGAHPDRFVGPLRRPTSAPSRATAETSNRPASPSEPRSTTTPQAPPQGTGTTDGEARDEQGESQDERQDDRRVRGRSRGVRHHRRYRAGKRADRLL